MNAVYSDIRRVGQIDTSWIDEAEFVGLWSGISKQNPVDKILVCPRNNWDRVITDDLEGPVKFSVTSK